MDTSVLNRDSEKVRNDTEKLYKYTSITMRKDKSFFKRMCSIYPSEGLSVNTNHVTIDSQGHYVLDKSKLLDRDDKPECIESLSIDSITGRLCGVRFKTIKDNNEINVTTYIKWLIDIGYILTNDTDTFTTFSCRLDVNNIIKLPLYPEKHYKRSRAKSARK